MYQKYIFSVKNVKEFLDTNIFLRKNLLSAVVHFFAGVRVFVCVWQKLWHVSTDQVWVATQFFFDLDTLLHCQ